MQPEKLAKHADLGADYWRLHCVAYRTKIVGFHVSASSDERFQIPLIKRFWHEYKPLPLVSAAINVGENVVTIDKSLKGAGRLVRARNVLKRSERIAQLQFEDRWQDGQSPLGLPKVRVVKLTVGKKKKKKKKEDEEGEGEGEETTDEAKE